MIRLLLMIAVLCAGFYATAAPAATHQPSKITVGYLLHWPLPAQFAQHKKTFDHALDLEVEWIPLANGNEMNDALARGKIQIAFAQGHIPFLAGVSRGLDLTMVGVAVDYANDDNCIVRSSAGIGPDNAARLAGNKVALRRGSLSHFRMLGVLRHLGVDPAGVEIVDVTSGQQARAALERGDVVMACASGNTLRELRSLGEPLMKSVGQSAIGLRVFDSITVASDFVHAHADIVQAFVDIVEASNKQWRKNPRSMVRSIARAADMAPASAMRALENFDFPTALEQKSDAWLGGDVVDYTKELADFFVSEGVLPRALESYDRFITTRFLR